MAQKRENSLATVLLLLGSVLLILVMQLILQGRNTAGESPEIPAGGDLAVIGGTTAALCTALEAAENGAQVFLFPDEQPLGEDSGWLVEAGLAAAWTPPQQELGIELTPEMLAAYLEEYGGGVNDPLLLLSFCQAAPNLFLEAAERGGLSFSFLPHPEEQPYLHYCSQPEAGLLLKNHLWDAIEKAGVIVKGEKVKEIKFTPAGKTEALLLEGPNGETSFFYVQAIVLADGGYSGDLYSRHAYLPQGNLLNLRPLQRGKGLRWAEEQGLDLVQMSFLETKLVPGPSGQEQDTVVFLPPAFWPGTILFNSKNQFLRAEEASFSQAVNFVLQSPAGGVWIMVPAGGAAASSPYFEEYAAWGELEKFGLPDNLLRPSGWRLPPPPYQVAPLQAGVVYTLGGLSITPCGEVKKEGKVVKGLYAAGEIVGGLHGETLLPGMPLSETFFTAKVAGRCAAEYAGR